MTWRRASTRKADFEALGALIVEALGVATLAPTEKPSRPLSPQPANAGDSLEAFAGRFGYDENKPRLETTRETRAKAKGSRR